MKLSDILRKVLTGENAAPDGETEAPQSEVAEREERLPEGVTVNKVGKRVIELKVSDVAAVRPPLPEGYFYPDAKQAAHLHAELLRELPDNHPLFGVPLETFAACERNDDTLFRYRGNPRLFVLVHLTWLGRTEIDEHHPGVVFTGSFEEWVKREEYIFNTYINPPAD